jgi:hypothetical protein
MSDPLDLDRLLPTAIHPQVAEAIPKALLIAALIDTLSGIQTPDELAERTALPRARAAEIVHLRELLTCCAQVTRQ